MSESPNKQINIFSSSLTILGQSSILKRYLTNSKNRLKSYITERKSMTGRNAFFCQLDQKWCDSISKYLTINLQTVMKMSMRNFNVWFNLWDSEIHCFFSKIYYMRLSIRPLHCGILIHLPLLASVSILQSFSCTISSPESCSLSQDKFQFWSCSSCYQRPDQGQGILIEIGLKVEY